MAISEVPFPVPGTVPVGSCVRFLLGEARGVRDTAALLDGICHALRAEAVPVDRALLLIPTLHPDVRALNFEWSGPGAPVVEVGHGWDAVDSDAFKRSPLKLLLDRTHDVIRRRICAPDCPRDFGIVDDLRASGFTDYVIVGAPSVAGAAGIALSFATRATGGFTDEQLARTLAAVPYILPLLDTHTALRVAGSLLNVYLGADAGPRVLAGAVKRGDGESIHAAVCFTDLRDFTQLSDRLPRAELLDLLDSYYDCVVSAVHQQGGEVLKFIGDAVLAVFRCAPADEGAACRAAHEAARDAFARVAVINRARADKHPIAFGMSIHVGEVMYGNIGGPERLDFTVIGPAVNLASRIQGLCRPLGRALLVSEAFVSATKLPCDDLGLQTLKGVEHPARVFTPRA